VSSGLAEADALWAEVEAAKKAEHAWRQAQNQAATRRQATARRYGGGQWEQLLGLLGEDGTEVPR